MEEMCVWLESTMTYHTQWWSNRGTQILHREQCFERAGCDICREENTLKFRIYHAQYILLLVWYVTNLGNFAARTVCTRYIHHSIVRLVVETLHILARKCSGPHSTRQIICELGKDYKRWGKVWVKLTDKECREFGEPKYQPTSKCWIEYQVVHNLHNRIALISCIVITPGHLRMDGVP